MKTPILFVIIYFIAAPLVAQQPKEDINIQQLIDDIYGIQDHDVNYEDLYENITLLLSHPVNLNKASTEELRFLMILSEHQITQFIEYREEHGALLSLYELQSIPGFDLETITRLTPFITVEESSGLHQNFIRQLFQHDNYFLLRYEQTLEKKRGFTNAVPENRRFKGSPGKIYSRFRSSKAGHYSLGYTMENDAGEQFKINSSQLGFDYTSFHFQLQNKKRIKNLIVGDFQSMMGQGLVLGGIFGIGKGAETITTTRRSSIGLVPYTSSGEAGYLRGIATTFEISPFIHATGYYASTRRDATLASDSTENFIITALPSSGLHRNESEISRRALIRETNYAAALTYRKKKVDAGIVFNTIQFSHPLEKTPTVYNQFTFSGKENHNTSLFLNYTFHNFTFFSETAKSFRGGAAVLAGLLGSLTSNLDLSIVYRNYARNYHSFYSNSFSENTLIQNEKGIYWGWKYRWNMKHNTSGYFDLFQFPWLKYRTYVPSAGHEWMIRYSYHPNKRTYFFAQAREENKVRNTGNDNSSYYITAEGIKRNYSFHAHYPLGNTLICNTRLQFSNYHLENESTKGFALSHDISWHFKKMVITARQMLFDTDDFDNRQYMYEKDAWLAFSIPSFYGKGIRNFCMIQYKLTRHVTCWLRYARVRYTDRTAIGSGLEAIEGNRKNDIKVQIKISI